MRLAEYLLDEGITPRALMKELGLDSSLQSLAKFDPNQPRVPAGNGIESGRWSSGMGTFVLEDDNSPPTPAGPAHASIGPAVAIADIAAAARTVGTFASGLFAAAETAGEFLAGLATFASSIGTGVALGAIVIPSPNNLTTEGSLPGDPDLNYSLNGDEGVLRLTHESDTGTELVAIAHRDRDGIFFEAETGTPIARQVGGSVVFDAASLANVAPTVQSQARTDARASTDQDGPQLCPAPSKDIPHGASDRAIAYQMQISALNNPQRPLRRGMAVSLINPATGRRVVYDDCREVDGTMIEAKGPGYAKLLRYSYFKNEVFPTRWAGQAGRQILASGGRQLDWFFAEDAAADRARQIFSKEKNLSRIHVYTVPPVMK